MPRKAPETIKGIPYNEYMREYQRMVRLTNEKIPRNKWQKYPEEIIVDVVALNKLGLSLRKIIKIMSEKYPNNDCKLNMKQVPKILSNYTRREDYETIKEKINNYALDGGLARRFGPMALNVVE